MSVAALTLARTGKLEPYLDYLRQRVEAARSHWIPAAVLCREVRDRYSA